MCITETMRKINLIFILFFASSLVAGAKDSGNSSISVAGVYTSGIKSEARPIVGLQLGCSMDKGWGARAQVGYGYTSSLNTATGIKDDSNVTKLFYAVGVQKCFVDKGAFAGYGGIDAIGAHVYQTAMDLHYKREDFIENAFSARPFLGVQAMLSQRVSVALEWAFDLLGANYFRTETWNSYSGKAEDGAIDLPDSKTKFKTSSIGFDNGSFLTIKFGFCF